MAKQTGPAFFKGTIGKITFYKSGGEQLAKKKNASPSRWQYQHKDSYANVRRNAGCFGLAQLIASPVYRTLSKEEKDQKRIWYPLRNKAQELVRKGLYRSEIITILELELTKLKEEVSRSKACLEKEPATAGCAPLLPQLPFERVTQSGAGENVPDHEILLGRYYARTDNLSLADELSAGNTVLRQFIHTENKTEESLALSQRKGLKATRKLRW
jgi:hypothetical protein